MARFLILLTALIACWTSASGLALADGKIQRARDSVRDRDDDRGSDEDDDSDEDYDEDDDNVGGQIIGGLLEAIFSDDESSSPREHREPPSSATTIEPYDPTYGYGRYPYANGHPGYLVPREVQLAYGGPIRPLARAPHDYAAQLSLEVGYLDDVARVGPHVRLLTPSRAEFSTRWTLLHETLDEAAPGEPTSDSTNLGSSHISPM